MKRLGVIGGLGPMATSYFLQLITQMCDAHTDQEHMEILIHNKPSIPDRTGYILNHDMPNPIPEIISIGKELKACGADLLAVPCITAHYFHDELEREVGLQVINAIEETIVYLKERGIKQVGILATTGTIRTELFQNVLKKYNMRGIVPDMEGQKLIMSIIYDNVKAGKEVDMERFFGVADELFKRNAQVVILGCTELSLLKRDYLFPEGYLDVMDILARKVVEVCNSVRPEYKELIT